MVCWGLRLWVSFVDCELVVDLCFRGWFMVGVLFGLVVVCVAWLGCGYGCFNSVVAVGLWLVLCFCLICRLCAVMFVLG